MPQKRKPDPVKYCASCNGLMTRKRFSGVLESMNVFLRRKFCGVSCMGKKMEKPLVELTLSGIRQRTHRAIPMNDACVECGATLNLQRHHIDEDKTNNMPGNVKTLCASCHAKWHWRNGKYERQFAGSAEQIAKLSARQGTRSSRKSPS